MNLEKYETAVDTIIDGLDNCSDLNYNTDGVPPVANDAKAFAQSLVDARMNSVNGMSVGASIGSLSQELCPLFEPTKSSLPTIPDTFTSPSTIDSTACDPSPTITAEISAITLNQAGVTAEFLSKIWQVLHMNLTLE